MNNKKDKLIDCREDIAHDVIGFQRDELDPLMDRLQENDVELTTKQVQSLITYLESVISEGIATWATLNLTEKKHCPHYVEGVRAIDYDDINEMRSSEMHCKLCGKHGSLEELLKDREEFNNGSIKPR